MCVYINGAVFLMSTLPCLCLQEGYAKYLETAMHVDTRFVQNRHQAQEQTDGANGQGQQETSLWPNAIAASALAIGAITVFTLKQAFS